MLNQHPHGLLLIEFMFSVFELHGLAVGPFSEAEDDVGFKAGIATGFVQPNNGLLVLKLFKNLEGRFRARLQQVLGVIRFAPGTLSFSAPFPLDSIRVRHNLNSARESKESSTRSIYRSATAASDCS